MKAVLISFTLVIAVSNQCQADDKKVFDIISYGTVLTNITLDTIHSAKSDNPKKALVKQGLNVGITVLSSEIIKRLIHEDRPDGSDNKSFWSEHTALAGVSTGYGKRLGLTFTVLTGTGRVLADRHHWWDVLVGGSVGLLVDGLID